MRQIKHFFPLRHNSALMAACAAIVLAGCAAPAYQTSPPGYPYPDAQVQPGQPVAQPDYRRRPKQYQVEYHPHHPLMAKRHLLMALKDLECQQILVQNFPQK